MPATAAGITCQKAFAHVPGMGVETPFRRDDGHALSANRFVGESRDNPGRRDDAGGHALEELASCFHKSSQVRPPRAQSRYRTSTTLEFLLITGDFGVA